MDIPKDAHVGIRSSEGQGKSEKLLVDGENVLESKKSKKTSLSKRVKRRKRKEKRKKRLRKHFTENGSDLSEGEESGRGRSPKRKVRSLKGIPRRPRGTGSCSRSSSGSRSRSSSGSRFTGKRSSGSDGESADSRRSSSPASVTRKRKPYKYWDVPPAGYEHMTVEQYKTMQNVGLLTPFIGDAQKNAPDSHLSFTDASTRQQLRRVFVGNIPHDGTSATLRSFLNNLMIQRKLTIEYGKPIVAVRIGEDKGHAFVELRSPAEANNLLSQNSIDWRGMTMRLRRPKYLGLAGEVARVTGKERSNVSPHINSPNKIFIGNLPHHMQDEQVRTILSQIGPLQGFNLVRDLETGVSKGFAFFEYEDAELTDKAVAALNGFQVGTKRVTVQRATVDGVKNKVVFGQVDHQVKGLDLSKGSGPMSNVLCLHNMVKPEELAEDEEYEDIIVDVRDECGKYGAVKSIEIPRPVEGVEVPGCGKIFVEFETLTDCEKAQEQLSGRRFAERVVVTSFFDLSRFQNKDF